VASLSGVLRLGASPAERPAGGSALLAWGEGSSPFQAGGEAQAVVLGPARQPRGDLARALAAWPGGAETILRPFLQAGMGFAFAVWEGGRLTLGADPWGLQTLYYREAGGQLGFSDRLADLTRPGEEKLHLASCEHFLRYLSIPPGRTLPIGLLLSGGMDSTALLALLREARQGPIVAIHAGAGDSPDRGFARAMAERHGAEFLDLTLTAEDARESLGWIVSSMEAPGGNASAVANCRAFALARERGLRRVVSGLGADEVFGGHRKHLLAPWWPWLGRLPLFIRQALARRASHPSLREALAAQGGPLEMHRAMYALMGEEEAARLRGGLARFAQVVRPEDGRGNPSRYPLALLQVDLDQWLRAALGPMAGTLAAADGLELALPLASAPMLRLSASMPLSWKVAGYTGKRLLREALRDFLPREILDRSRKGFTVPVAEWLRGELAGTARELLAPGKVERWCLLEREGPLRLLGEHVSGRADWGLALWGWMTFSAWYDRFFPAEGGM
ncbi:MAG: asparagine synthase C-terminal domain-containing protein, partial [Candidatus Tectomicrobia bacterium]|nr:asparagine synthase C-terminal domain-containing protein [Candidatus Tectomicrobia bacterium]